MPDHPAIQTRKYLFVTPSLPEHNMMFSFLLLCHELYLSSAMAGLWSCFSVTTLGVPGTDIRSFLGTSSEKPCNWVALMLAVFIITCWSCGLCYITFFCWLLKSERANCTACFEACSRSESHDVEYVVCVTWLGAKATGMMSYMPDD